MSGRVVKLGEAGKWHTLVASGVMSAFTACSVELRPIESSLRVAELKYGDGEPTCKNCVRIGDKRHRP